MSNSFDKGAFYIY